MPKLCISRVREPGLDFWYWPIEKGLGLGLGEILWKFYESGEIVFIRLRPLAADCRMVLLLLELGYVSQFLQPLHLQAPVHGTPKAKHSQ